MAEAKGRSDWNQTACLLAQTAELNRDTKRRTKPFSPDEFNPYVRARKVTPIPSGINALKALAGGRTRTVKRKKADG